MPGPYIILLSLPCTLSFCSEKIIPQIHFHKLLFSINFYVSAGKRQPLHSNQTSLAGFFFQMYNHSFGLPICNSSPPQEVNKVDYPLVQTLTVYFFLLNIKCLLYFLLYSNPSICLQQVTPLVQHL